MSDEVKEFIKSFEVGNRVERTTEETPLSDFMLGKNEQKDSAFKRSVSEGLKKKSDTAAKILNLQEATRIPSKVIERNLEQVEHKSKLAGFNVAEFREKAPVTSQWMREDPNNSALVVDDIYKLGYIERLLRHSTDSFKKGLLQDKLQDIGGSVLWGSVTPEQRNNQRSFEHELTQFKDLGISGYFEGIPGTTAEQLPVFWNIAKGSAAGGAIAGVTAFGIGAGVSLWTGGGAVAVGTAYAIPAMKAGALLGMVYQAFKMESSHAILEYEREVDANGDKLDFNTARGGAIIVGSVNSVLEALGGSQVLRLIPALNTFKRKAFKQVLKIPTIRKSLIEFSKNIGKAVTAEGATEFSQELNTAVTGKIQLMMQDKSYEGKSFGELFDIIFDAETMNRAIEAGRKGSQAAFGLGGATSSIGLGYDIHQSGKASSSKGLLNLARSYSEARKADASKESLDAMAEAIQNTDSMKKAYGPIKNLVRRMIKDSPNENVYIPIETFEEYFQDKGIDLEEAAAELAGPDNNYLEAKRSGTDLVVPTENYATTIAMSPEAHGKFADTVRTGENEMNVQEARKLYQDMETMAGEKLEETKKQMKEVQPQLNDLRTQMSVSGIYNAEEVDLQMKMLEHWVRVQSIRKEMPPKEFMARYPIHIGTEGYQKGKTYFQERVKAPPFYSKLERTIEALPDTFTVEELKGATKQGIKPAEMKWSGFDKFVAAHNKRALVSPEDIIKHWRKSDPGGELPEGFSQRVNAFDSYELREIEINDIDTAPDTDWEIEEKWVKKYAEKETEAPAIIVQLKEDGTYDVVDGKTRTEAAKLKGKKKIKAYVGTSKKIKKEHLLDHIRAMELEIEEVIATEEGKALPTEEEAAKFWAYTEEGWDALGDQEKQNKILEAMKHPDYRSARKYKTKHGEPSLVTPGGQNYKEIKFVLAPKQGEIKELNSKKELLEKEMSDAASEIYEADIANDEEINKALKTQIARAKELQNQLGELELSENKEYSDLQNESYNYRKKSQIALREKTKPLWDKHREASEELVKIRSKIGLLKKQNTFEGGHFEPNTLAHARINERVDSEGNRVLFIEEIQSDWIGEGRRRGFGKEKVITGYKAVRSATINGETVTTELGSFNTKGRAEEHVNTWKKEDKTSEVDYAVFPEYSEKINAVPDHPFRNNWHEYVLKRLIRYAAEEGFDKIAWTTGEMQAERYDLSKKIERVSIYKSDPLTKEVTGMAYPVRDGSPQSFTTTKATPLEDYVGKDLAQKFEAMEWSEPSQGNETPKKTLSGLDLKVGGEKHKHLYDKMIPSFLKKFTKKYGAKVEESSIGNPYELTEEDFERTDFEEDDSEAGVTDKWSLINAERFGDLEYIDLEEYTNADGNKAYDANIDGNAQTVGKTFNEAIKNIEKIINPQEEGSGITVPSLHITPALKTAAIEEGFVLYQTISPLGFYLELEKRVEEMDFKSIPAKDLLSRIDKLEGVKKEEIEFLGIKEWLTLKAADNQKVTKRTTKDGMVGILDFIRSNGPVLRQVVYSDSYTDPKKGVSAHEKVQWEEGDWLDADEDDVESEANYYFEENLENFKHSYPALYEETIIRLAEENEDFDIDTIDEKKLLEALEEDHNDKVSEDIRESIESGNNDSYSRREYDGSIMDEDGYEKTFTLQDDRGGEGYYSSDTQKHYEGSLEEAQLSFVNDLIASGEIVDDPRKHIKEEDINWTLPRGVFPSESTLKRKASELYKKDPELYTNKVLEGNFYFEEGEYSFHYKNQLKTGKITQEQYDRKLKTAALKEALIDAKKLYSDISNKKNSIIVSFKHSMLKGKLKGNNVNGWVFSYDSGFDEIEDTEVELESINIDNAKVEATQVLKDKGIILPENAEEKPAEEKEAFGPPGVNEPTKRALHKSYIKNVGDLDNFREIAIELPLVKPSHWSHFGEKVLVHVLLADKTDEQGNKHLYIVELQSDWHQAGHKQGYVSENQERRTKVRNVISKIISERESSINEPGVDFTVKKYEGYGDNKYDILFADGFNSSDISFKTKSTALEWAKNSKEVTEYAALEEAEKEGLISEEDIYYYKHREISEDVPDIMMKNTDIWTSLMLKRVFRYATDLGYDNVGWAAGEDIAERWAPQRMMWLNVGDGFLFGPGDMFYEMLAESKPEYNEELGKYILITTDNKYVRKSPSRRGYSFTEDKEDAIAFEDGNDAVEWRDQTKERTGKIVLEKGSKVSTKKELLYKLSDDTNLSKGEKRTWNTSEQIWKEMQEHPVGNIDIRGKGNITYYNTTIKKNVEKIIKKAEKLEKDPAKLSKVGVATMSDVDKQFWKVPLTDKAKDNFRGGQGMFQDDKRGSIQFGKQGININLLKDANLSTFLHETGHLFFHVLADGAGQEGADPQIQQDYQAVLNWFGITSPEELTVEHQEKWAKAWEKYLMEGKSPSESLKAAFARFRSWLIRIYKRLSSLDVELTDEVRGVMDRLVATDEEIEAARLQQNMMPLFPDPKEVGMNDQDGDAYTKMTVDARAEEQQAAQQKLLKEVNRENNKHLKEQKDIIREEVTEEVNQEKIYIALSILQTGKLPNGEELPTEIQKIKEWKELKLSKKEIIDDFGEDWLGRLPKPFIYSATGGIHPDEAAQIFGFNSGSELLHELSIIPEKQKLIDNVVEARMKKQFGDFRDSVPVVAMQAVHSDKRSHILLKEMKHMTTQSFATVKNLGKRISRPLPKVEEVRANAEAIINGMKVRRINPYLYQRAEAKAAKEAINAFWKGDFEAVFEEKNRELLNHELYRAAVAKKEEAEKIVNYMKKFEKKAVRERIGKAGFDYLDQIDEILDRFDFRKSISGKALDERKKRRKSLEKWVESQEDQGIPVDIPQKILNETYRQHYKDTPFFELEEIRDTVKKIEHLAKVKNELLANKAHREFQAAEDEIVAEIEANHDTTIEPPDVAPKLRDTIKDLSSAGIAKHTKMEFLFEFLAGWKAAGASWRIIFQPLADAENAKSTMIDGITERLRQIFEVYSRAERVDWHTKRVFIPETKTDKWRGNFNKVSMLAIALNWGNEYSRQSLMEGYGWNESQVQAVLDRLDQRDWDAIQEVWDYINTFWPQVEALEKRLHGIAPQKVEAAPIETKYGTYPGGYYPLIFNPKLPWKSSMRQAVVMEASNTKELFPGNFTRAMTRHGHTEERTNSGGKPVLLNLSGMVQHLTDVAHDLTHREVIIDTHKLINSERIRKAIIGAAGFEMYKQLNPWLQNIARERVSDFANHAEGLFSKMRSGATVVNMGAKLTTALVQPLGYAISAKELGPKYALKGIQEVYSTNPIELSKKFSEAYNFAISNSEFMRDRMKNFDRDIRDMSKRLNITGTKPGYLATLDKYTLTDKLSRLNYFILIAYADMSVSLPTWLGAYHKAMDGKEGNIKAGHEQDAINYADRTVRITQGSGGPKDLAAMQRGPELWKLFQMFYSFFSVFFNQFAKVNSEFKADKNVMKYLSAMIMIWFIPAVLEDIVRNIGYEDEDKERNKKYISYITYPVQGIIILRDVFNSALNFGYSPSAGFDVLETGGKVLKTGFDMIADREKEFSSTDLKNMVNLTGYSLGLPTRQVWLTGDYFYYWLTGEEQPESPQEFMWRGFVTGKKRD